MHPPRVAARGFTLTELLIVVAIAGVLAVIGAPAMGGLLARSRGASAEASIATALRQARTAAIMRNHRVVACPSANGLACDDTSDWQNGWLIADDADHDGQPDKGKSVIAVFPAISSGARITSSTGRKLVAFHPNGSAAGSNASFTICNTRSGYGEAVVVSNAGRVRTAVASQQHLQACLAGLR